VNNTLDTLGDMIQNMLENKEIDSNLAALLLRIADYELSRNSLLNDIQNVLAIIGGEELIIEEGNQLDEEIQECDINKLEAEISGLISTNDSFYNQVELYRQEVDNEQQLTVQMQESIDGESSKIKSLVNDKLDTQAARNQLVEAAMRESESYEAESRSIERERIDAQQHLEIQADERDRNNRHLQEMDDVISSLTGELNTLEAGNESDDKLASQLATEIMIGVKQLAALNGKLNLEKESILTIKSRAVEVSNMIDRESVREASLLQRSAGYAKEVDLVSSELNQLISFLRDTRESIHTLQQQVCRYDTLSYFTTQTIALARDM
jgi:chromosome segregation ATPase